MKKSLEKARTYIPENLDMHWETLMPIFQELKDRNIDSPEESQRWLADRSELEAALSEDFAWRYIRMTCNTNDEKFAEEFQYFATEIEPKIAPISNELDQKLNANPHLNSLEDDGYDIYIRKVETTLEIFREENIPLFTEMQLKQQEYQRIAGELSVFIDGQELTLQQAGTLLLETNRSRREEVWKSINEARLAQKEAFEKIFVDLLQLRHSVARNAGFANYRDYMFAAMGRFDYSVEDCEAFHESVRKIVVPVLQ